MKQLFTMVVVVLALALAGVAQNVTSEELRFREAVHKEQVEGDLAGAIRLYTLIASGNTANRALTAKALLNLARCYEKQGKADARKTYERIVREFPDQGESARQARTRLAKITLVRMS